MFADWKDGSMLKQVPVRRFVSAAGAAVASFALSCFAVHPAMAQSDGVRIGIVSPNTGAAARYGAFAWRGGPLARHQPNSPRGIRGQKFELFQGYIQRRPSPAVSPHHPIIAP